MTGTDIIRKASADEIVAHRDRALEHYRLGLEYIASAMAAHKLACRDNYAATAELKAVSWYRIEDGRFDDIEKIRRRLDADVWEYMLGALGMKNVMDAKAIEEFREQNRKNPPQVTRDNLVATFGHLNDNRQEIFERGVVNLFARLKRGYKSNDAFRLDKKIVLNSVLSTSFGGWSHWTDGDARVRDLDRIFHILDGKAPKDHSGDAAALIGSVRELPGTLETDYFDCRLFKNGNLHLTFRRPDLVREANRIVAKHGGATLAHGQTRKPAK